MLAVLRQNKAILHAGHTSQQCDEPRHIFSHQQRAPFTLNFPASPKTIFGTMTPARSSSLIPQPHGQSLVGRTDNVRNETEMRHALYIQLFAVALDALHPVIPLRR